MEIPFGKYKGQEISSFTDIGYISWMLENMDNLEEPLKDELSKRLDELKDSDDIIMPFGKFQGRLINELAVEEKGYLEFILENMDSLDGALKDVIKKSIED
jgi:uncharacterized protein (DUF3820 family)